MTADGRFKVGDSSKGGKVEVLTANELRQKMRTSVSGQKKPLTPNAPLFFASL